MMTFVKKLSPVLLLVILLAVVCRPLHAGAVEYKCEVNLDVAVSFNGDKNTPFSIKLETQEQAPLPEQSELTLKGSGTVTFGPITYTAPGDYHYTMTQTKGNAQYVTYDSTVYTVTVRVTNATNGGLQAEIWAERNEETEKVSEFTFANRYDPPEQPSNQPTPTPVPVTTEGDTTSTTQSSTLFHLPQTGDDFPLAVLLILCIAAAAGLGYSIYRKQRGKQK